MQPSTVNRYEWMEYWHHPSFDSEKLQLFVQHVGGEVPLEAWRAEKLDVESFLHRSYGAIEACLRKRVNSSWPPDTDKFFERLQLLHEKLRYVFINDNSLTFVAENIPTLWRPNLGTRQHRQVLPSHHHCHHHHHYHHHHRHHHHHHHIRRRHLRPRILS